MTLLASDPLLDGSPFQGYAYSYPHKTAYRSFDVPIPLHEAWREERRDALFLYLHVPFCEMRCGFCNLFTQARPRAGFAETYLDALERQMNEVRAVLGETRFARFAVGGGTPTALDLRALERLFDLAGRMLGGSMDVPSSVETSPETADWERLTLLRERRIARVSIGVQSFDDAETAALGRPQKSSVVHGALERIRAIGFPTLNIDLIYGIEGQGVESWLASLRRALRYQPEELYLYPLYVRPLTGLGRSERSWDDQRLTCYREAAALLESEGYEQVSMRMFRAAHAPEDAGPVYCCQEDGMVGLGCGARSYTKRLHYSDRYAVRSEAVRAILEEYVARPSEAFGSADYGFQLDEAERLRRHILMSLLQRTGMSLANFVERFGRDVFEALPQLRDLEERGLAGVEAGRLTLTAAGLERSDVIGPWLYSPRVRARMEESPWN